MSTSDYNPFSDEGNPYAAPTSDSFSGDADNRPAAVIRREYLSHEASIQSIGLLYMLGFFFGILIGGVGLTVALSGNAAPGVAELGVAVFFTGLGIAQGFVGYGLRKLRRWTRIPVGLISGFGLLGVPLGTLINGYILYLVFGRKGQMVFSDEYQEIIRQTPEIKYRTSIVVWILLFLLLSLIVFGIVIAVGVG